VVAIGCNGVALVQPIFNQLQPHLHLLNSRLIIIIPKGIHWVQMVELGVASGCNGVAIGCKWLQIVALGVARVTKVKH